MLRANEKGVHGHWLGLSPVILFLSHLNVIVDQKLLNYLFLGFVKYFYYKIAYILQDCYDFECISI